MRILVIMFGLIGCATQQQVLRPPDVVLGKQQAAIAFYSEPPGASIMVNDKFIGTAPITLKWTLPDGATEGVSSQPVTALWISGAKATFTPKIIGGKPQYYAFQRPAAHPSAEADMEHGRRLLASTSGQQPPTIASDQALQLFTVLLGGAVGYQQGRNMATTNQLLMHAPNNTETAKRPARAPDYNCEQSVLGNSYSCTPR